MSRWRIWFERPNVPELSFIVRALTLGDALTTARAKLNADGFAVGAHELIQCARLPKKREIKS